MPTYEYECLKCGKSFETIQSMKDSPLKTCPKDLCQNKVWGKGKVKRLLSGGAGIIFKGSGFYTTDYRSENYKKGAKQESGAPAKTASPESKPTESKPAPEKKAKADK